MICLVGFGIIADVVVYCCIILVAWLWLFVDCVSFGLVGNADSFVYVCDTLLLFSCCFVFGLDWFVGWFDLFML